MKGEPIAWVNGEFKPLAKACVNIEDRGFQFADGVYEVIACLGGVMIDLEEHLDRLQRSADAIDLKLPLGKDELAELIRETYRRNPYPDAMLYLQLTRGVAPRAHLPTEDIAPTLVITARELPRPSEEAVSNGVAVITLEDFRWRRCDIKSIALLANVMGKQQAVRRQAEEAFWLDEEGHVLEGCSTNCFAYIDHVLVTHPCDHRVLGGVTRKLVLRLARRHGLTIQERPWRLDEAGLSEVFMTSTTRFAVPVCWIDGKRVGDGKPGPVSLSVRRWLLRYFDELRG